MKKKRLYLGIILAAAVLLGSLLSCAFPVRADEDYGELAYTYLRYLNDHYPYRVNNSEVQESQEAKQEAGLWIDTLMRGFGYSGYTIDGDRSIHNGNQVCDYCYLKRGTSSKKIVIGAHYDSVLTKGAEDNGTGVAALLELARRFANVQTPMSIEFCFWDGEEFLGEAGSFEYVGRAISDRTLSTILLYINLDCVGSGDRLYAYGGDYENGVLVRDWGYNMAMSLANELGISLSTIPGNITRFPAPTRTGASDQLFFADQKVPYLYFEANAWVDASGREVIPDRPYNYNTTDPRVTATEYTWPSGKTYQTVDGQLIHAQAYDDLDVLESLFPGRIKKHMGETIRIVSEILRTANESSPDTYRTIVTPDEPAPTEPAATEPATEPSVPVTSTESPSSESSADPAASSSGEETSEEPGPGEGSLPETDATGDETEDTPAETSSTPETDETDQTAGLNPVNAPLVAMVIFVIALWGIWAYVYLKYYR